MTAVDQYPALYSSTAIQQLSNMVSDTNDPYNGLIDLAIITKNTNEARAIMNSFHNTNAKMIWALIWNIEAVTRLEYMRRQDPDGILPNDLQPLGTR
jgi:capsular polysaccharide biosynthesis protein